MLLQANPREITGKQVKELREQGNLPAVLYGQKTEAQKLSVKEIDFHKIYEQAGENTIIDLKVDDQEPIKALIYDVQYDVVSHKIIHIDFYHVRMDQKITATIPLEFVGQSPAVKEEGGILITNLSEVEVKCLPNDLPKDIKVDLSSLETFDNKIMVKDLPIGENVELLTNVDSVVATVAEPRSQEEVEAAAEAPPEEEALPEEVAEGDEEKSDDEGAKEKEESTESEGEEKKE